MKPGASSQTRGIENDPDKMAEERKEKTNRTYLLSIFFEAFRSTAKEGAMCD